MLWFILIPVLAVVAWFLLRRRRAATVIYRSDGWTWHAADGSEARNLASRDDAEDDAAGKGYRL